MARYYSDDGILDAPVEKVWKLINAHATEMTKIHAGVLSSKATPQPDGSVLADVTTKGADGKPVAQRWRFTMRPPQAQNVEITEGPLKGTWFTTSYLPEGASRTRLVTVAEWKVQGVTDEATLKKMAHDFFENGFAEDERYLKTMK